MEMTIETTDERELDDAQKRVTDATTRLVEATHALAETKAALDGSEPAAKKWELAERTYKRRQAELANAEATLQTAHAQLELRNTNVRRAKLAQKIEQADYKITRANIAKLGAEAAAKYVEAQRLLDSARELARVQRDAVASARSLGVELHEVIVVSALEPEEALVTFFFAAATAADEAGVRLEEPLFRQPQPFERSTVDTHNRRAVLVDLEDFDRAKTRAMQWRELTLANLRGQRS